MEHKSLDRIRAVADVLPDWLSVRPLSKCERLERWAEALEREGGRRLKTLFEIEYVTPMRRAALRADDSPLTVAFNDPTLRAQGLAGDTLGDATAFFGVSEWEIHNILCFCHHGDTMSADVAAMRVRAAAAHYARHSLPRARTVAFGSFMAALAAIGVLAI